MTIAEFIYAVLLRPKPLRALANSCIRLIIPRQIRRDGITVILNPNDPVNSGALTFNVYERGETRFFQSVLRPGMTAVDIGANIGLYTALAVSRIGNTGRVVAVEADRESFQYLRQTVAANNAANVTCIPKAAADHCGVMRLFVSTDNRGDNRLYDNELCSDSYEVEVVTMDALLDELGISSVDVVKIDVQGYEGHVLEGMRNTLDSSSNVTILMEFWPHGLRCSHTQPEQLLRDLEKMGFEISELESNGRLAPVRDTEALIGRYRGRRYTNIVAVKRPVHNTR